MIIRLELEAAPRVYSDLGSDADWARLTDWLNAHPEQARIVRAALDLVRQERAA